MGVEKFGNYFRKKGWIESGDKRQASELAEAGEATKVEKKGRFSKWRNNRERKEGRVSKWWGRGETGTRLVVEFATAYAVVKALVPLRLFLSVWGAPWFARWTVVPFSNMVKGWFRGSSKKVGTGAAAAGAGAGGTKGLNSEKITK